MYFRPLLQPGSRVNMVLLSIKYCKVEARLRMNCSFFKDIRSKYFHNKSPISVKNKLGSENTRRGDEFRLESGSDSDSFAVWPFSCCPN